MRVLSSLGKAPPGPSAEASNNHPLSPLPTCRNRQRVLENPWPKVRGFGAVELQVSEVWSLGALALGFRVWALGLWGFGALGLWGLGALGLWGFGALGLWGFGALALGFRVLGLTRAPQFDSWVFGPCKWTDKRSRSRPEP